jgi:hypothetical protein
MTPRQTNLVKIETSRQEMLAERKKITPAAAPLKNVQRQGTGNLQDRLAMRTHPHERENKNGAQKEIRSNGKIQRKLES